MLSPLDICWCVFGFAKAWLTTYFDLLHSQIRYTKAVCNCVQFASLKVANRNCNHNFIITSESKKLRHGRIILAKEQLDYSYTFWTMPSLISSPVQIIMGHPLLPTKIRLNRQEVDLKVWQLYIIPNPSTTLVPFQYFTNSQLQQWCNSEYHTKISKI